jgi:hypothetical protein
MKSDDLNTFGVALGRTGARGASASSVAKPRSSASTALLVRMTTVLVQDKSVYHAVGIAREAYAESDHLVEKLICKPVAFRDAVLSSVGGRTAPGLARTPPPILNSAAPIASVRS